MQPSALDRMNTAVWSWLEATQQFVQFVCGVEVRFQFAGSELVAQFVQPASKQIQPRRKNFPVRQHNVPPGTVRTACEAQRIAQTRACERDGQAIFVQMIVKK